MLSQGSSSLMNMQDWLGATRRGQGMFGDQYGCAVGSNGEAGRSDQQIVTALLCGNALLGAGLTHLLTGTRFKVIDAGRPGESASAGQADAVPGLYVIDASGSPQQTITLVEDAKRHHPSARIVVIATSFDLGLVRLTVAAGVDSFCLATVDREVLINVLELTVLGEPILPGSVLQSLLDEPSTVSALAPTPSTSEPNTPDPRVEKLSPRETVILQSLMGGEANKVIARKLEITEATIKVHVKSILRKIGAANRTQAAMWANENLRPGDRPFLNA
ncbi:MULTISPECIES: LuxR C-terminal-related transcriptional regulator [Microvirga]|uniref:LuxR C-terminal-related transcriptional regulator n=1 Tax=Microvirga TaxID=186650 RepID=UPI001FFC864B|nr:MULTISPECIES: response regulator transcription factor [unclassified Microvirga]